MAVKGVSEPAGRKAGIKGADVAALVDKLKHEAKSSDLNLCGSGFGRDSWQATVHRG